MAFGLFKENKRGENTREALTSAKARKGQTSKARQIINAQLVDVSHSTKIDKRIRNKAQKLAKRELKRAGLLY
jgi:hypothetical protein